MSEKDFKIFEEFTKRLLATPVSKEEALRQLQTAGILDSDGNHTAPYRLLGKYCKPVK